MGLYMDGTMTFIMTTFNITTFSITIRKMIFNISIRKGYIQLNDA